MAAGYWLGQLGIAQAQQRIGANVTAQQATQAASLVPAGNLLVRLVQEAGSAVIFVVP